jgi:hypothetical protein
LWIKSSQASKHGIAGVMGVIKGGKMRFLDQVGQFMSLDFMAGYRI